ncbi:MAG TPA: hypothetical protein VN039_17550, partial [Nitrospira sp.]|nr:hypothetical protein [Nitrospira sp.]
FESGCVVPPRSSAHIVCSFTHPTGSNRSSHPLINLSKSLGPALMTSWRDLGARRGKADSYGDRLRIEREMKGLAQRVRDNPEIERVLAQAAKAQGIDMKGRTVAQEMERRIAKNERERGFDR